MLKVEEIDRIIDALEWGRVLAESDYMNSDNVSGRDLVSELEQFDRPLALLRRERPEAVLRESRQSA